MRDRAAGLPDPRPADDAAAAAGGSVAGSPKWLHRAAGWHAPGGPWATDHHDGIRTLRIEDHDRLGPCPGQPDIWNLGSCYIACTGAI